MGRGAIAPISHPHQEKPHNAYCVAFLLIIYAALIRFDPVGKDVKQLTLRQIYLKGSKLI